MCWVFWNPNLDPSDCLYSLDLRSVACRTGLLGCGPTVVAYFHQQTIINSTRHYNNQQTAALASGNFLVVKTIFHLTIHLTLTNMTFLKVLGLVKIWCREECIRLIMYTITLNRSSWSLYGSEKCLKWETEMKLGRANAEDQFFTFNICYCSGRSFITCALMNVTFVANGSLVAN